MSAAETIAQQPAELQPSAAKPDMPNPYVGPRPFEREEEELFFGRDREARDLVSLIIANRVFVLYSQSGAGKSSLLNAKVVAGLENERCRVLPIARVQGKIPANIDQGAIRNIFSFSTVSCLGDKDHPLEAAQLYTISVSQFLATVRPDRPDADDDDDDEPLVLIFDQFEELFSLYEYRWRDRAAFLQEILEALATFSELRVVFALREDYIAKLDAFAANFPNRLRARYYLERLREDAALEAISGPAAIGGRSFAPGVAEKIVDDLLETYSPDIRGKSVRVDGEFIEPVQLQVVCSNLWRSTPPPETEITEKHLQQSGNVDEALGRFYDESVAAIASKTNVSALRIRRWVERNLVTTTGRRGTVFRDVETTAGMPNKVVDELENYHLIRADWRAGAQWYEITHDRLLRPIRESNRVQLERARRELTGIAAAVAVFFLVVVVWSFLRGHQASQRANEATQRADALQLADTSSKLPQSNIDLALLLAVEAYRTQDSTATRSNLLSQVQRADRIDRLKRVSTSGDLTPSVRLPRTNLIASVGSDRSLLVWSETTNSVAGWPLNGDPPFSLFADGTFIYAISSRGEAQVFDSVRGNVGTALADSELLAQLKSGVPSTGLASGPPDVLYVADPDIRKTVALASGRLLVARGGDIIVTDTKSHSEIGRFRIGDTTSNPPVKVVDVGLSPDGQFGFAVACEIGSARPGTAGSSQPRSCGRYFSRFWRIDAAHGLSLLPAVGTDSSAPYVAIGSSDDNIWTAMRSDVSVDVRKYQVPLDVQSTRRVAGMSLDVALPVTGLLFSDDCKRLISISGGQAISWNLDGPRRLERVVHAGVPFDLATSGDLLASVQNDGYFVINPKDGREVLSDMSAPAPGWESERAAGFAGVDFASGKLLVAQDGRIRLVAQDGGVRLGETNQGRELVSINTDPAAAISTAIDPLGKYIAAGYIPPWVRDQNRPSPIPNVPPIDYSHVPVLWNATDGKPVLFVDLKPPASSAPNGNTSDQNQAPAPDGSAKVGDSRPWAAVGVAFSPDGKYFVVAKATDGGNGSIDFYMRNESPDGPAYSKTPLPSALGSDNNPAVTKASYFAKFSSDGKLLAVSQDSGVMVFSTTRISRQIVQRGEAARLALSPDGSLLAVDFEGSLTLWDVERSTPFGVPIRGGDGPLPMGVAFSPDNRQLFTADSTLNSLVSYDLSVDTWIRHACEIASRELTATERATYHLPESGAKTCPPELGDRDVKPAGPSPNPGTAG